MLSWFTSNFANLILNLPPPQYLGFLSLLFTFKIVFSMNKWTVSILSVGVIFGVWSFFQRKNDTPKIYYLKNLPFGFNGFIVPPLGVFIKEEHRNSEELVLHELVHWKQYQREGLVKFLINYSKVSHQKGYDANDYEIEARYRESDFCKSNYTYCVRNGMAKTAHNPNFRSGR